MINHMDETFPFFPADISKTEPLGEVSMRRMIEGIRNPDDKVKGTFDTIRKARELGDNATKDKYKRKLFYFIPGVKLEGGRALTNIVRHNPFLVAEFDKIDFAHEIKKTLFDFIPSCICAFISPSGNGAKFIFRIPRPENVHDHKEWFCSLAFYLEHIKGFDHANFNVVLPLYLSWDEDILWREDAVEWDGRFDKSSILDLNPNWVNKDVVKKYKLFLKGTKISQFKPSYDDSEFGKYENDRDTKVHIIDWFTKRIIGIESEGHPIVRNCSLTLGGYVASGYLTIDEGYEVIDNAINQSEYLAKNPRGYLKTAHDMLLRGTLAPLEWNT